MEFLTTQGKAEGCLSNRFLNCITKEGKPLDKTFGYGLWQNISYLKNWVWKHPTHLEILRVASKYMKEVGADGKLRLFHEIALVKPED